MLLAKETYLMRLLNLAVCATVSIGLLAGCAGTMGQNSMTPAGVAPQVRYAPISVFDDATAPRFVSVLHSMVLPDRKRKLPKAGTYVSEFYNDEVFAYHADNSKDKKPICTIQGVLDVNGLAVDGKGNLVEPDGGTAVVNVYQGPTMCGKLVDSISDPYGQAADASSPDALNGKIVVSNLQTTTGGDGDLTVCTVSAGCSVELTNSNIYHAGGVAMSNSGDCWTDAKTSVSGGAALIYFKGCAGGGKVASGFKSTYYGGIDIDNSGNLVVIDDMAENIYIYKGCNPKCKVVGGPFALKGETFFGKLNAKNTEYIAVDRTDALVDVYSYSTKGLKFEYDYDNSLAASETPDGVAENPRSQQ